MKNCSKKENGDPNRKCVKPKFKFEFKKEDVSFKQEQFKFNSARKLWIVLKDTSGVKILEKNPTLHKDYAERIR